MQTVLRKISICILFFCVLTGANGQTVPSSQVLQYLKQKIKVYYTGRPNDIMNFSIHEISADTISANTDGVIFGRGGNNRMSTSARLLLSLFKERNNGGDGSFQDWVYQVLRIKDKPVNLYFFNDVMLPISEMAAFHAGLDTVSRDGGLRVFPAVWGRNNDTEAGNIQIGEYIFDDDLRLFKNTFIELIGYAALGSYRTLHNSGIYYFTHSGLDNAVFYCSESLMDCRFSVDQAICMAMARTFDTARQRLLYNWVTRPSLTLRKQLPAVTETTLSRYWLLNQEQYRSISSLFSVLPMPPYSLNARNSNGWFNFSNQETRNETGKLYKLRNEVTLAVVLNYIIRKEGLPKFLDIIKYDDYRYLSAPLIQNFPLFLKMQ
ncbi:MAG: hypothetical protein IPM85_15590 [Chitinophagaceae bacterium]|nr:hypothetical protein [Chitinophagaceae bacterium]